MRRNKTTALPTRHRMAGPAMALLLALVLAPSPAHAAWRFDASRFSASAHGDFACADCHDIDPAAHPDPALVDRAPASFFDKDHCLTCHADVEGDIASGRHAGFKVPHPERFEVCTACHDPHDPHATKAAAGTAKPIEAGSFSVGDQACLACHALPGTAGPTARDAAGTKAGGAPLGGQEGNANLLCFACHAADSGVAAPLVSESDFRRGAHGSQRCEACHAGAAAFPHARVAAVTEDCLACHTRHPESEIGDAHLGVSCVACHSQGATPIRAPGGMLVAAALQTAPGQVTRVHDMSLAGEENCARCHAPGNAVGASASVLPAKSVLCAVCHVATFTVQDATSWLGLIVFLIGVACAVILVLGCYAGRGDEAGPAARLGRLGLDCARGLGRLVTRRALGALVMDVLLQRRLYRRGWRRWAVHALIFWPFALRCAWGLVALLGEHLAPAQGWVWTMVDKNAPLGAFFFDLTGLMLLAGVALAWLRGGRADKSRLAGTPGQDKWALGLIGGIALLGFVLEGLRIAQTGALPGMAYAFVGYALAPLFEQAWSQEAYAWLWRLHAICTAGFFAYLPFSRLRHVIAAPFVLALNANDTHGQAGHGH